MSPAIQFVGLPADQSQRCNLWIGNVGSDHGFPIPPNVVSGNAVRDRRDGAVYTCPFVVRANLICFRFMRSGLGGENRLRLLCFDVSGEVVCSQHDFVAGVAAACECALFPRLFPLYDAAVRVFFNLANEIEATTPQQHCAVGGRRHSPRTPVVVSRSMLTATPTKTPKLVSTPTKRTPKRTPMPTPKPPTRKRGRANSSDSSRKSRVAPGGSAGGIGRGGGVGGDDGESGGGAVVFVARGCIVIFSDFARDN